ncbi:MAG: 2-amino-4-hydroxy-6-hydroxymethyldihydropteridine diphosphokinase [Spirochaetaceae bacterium]|jgi:2-amino-4-hydroxy-6-hydroxymethyldihydropteridine diphosphokinase|nr:2-amino-4-hydroxy-6-hydroxymethyldihydropteridine diphosphokinase [Spirochaetaceae bacterium]
METVYIALGSNMGDREYHLTSALTLLSGAGRVAAVSGVYQTEPVGYTDQAPFLNMACRLEEVSLTPFDLLAHLQEIETALERKRLVRWGPRTIDLDILLYGTQTVTSPTLTIPHERMFQRAFVLAPLRDIYPCAEIGGVSLKERFESCADRAGIAPYLPSRDLASCLTRR